MHIYPQSYFECFAERSATSAAIVLPIIKELFRVTSVGDFGCGCGTWLAVWRELGVEDVLGLDGDYVPSEMLQIPPSQFLATDLTQPINLGRRFDLVQSLEVAEHLPDTAASTLVENLITHSPLVLFSAATPGQGGEHHVNERPYEFWRRLFRDRGYVLLDPVRPRVRENKLVEPWYRYNTMVFVQEHNCAELRPDVLTARIPDHSTVPSFLPRATRARHRLTRLLPRPVITGAAVAARWCQLLCRRFSSRARLQARPRRSV